jgi:hypothetical protein
MHPVDACGGVLVLAHKQTPEGLHPMGMNVNLTPQLEELVRSKVAAGKPGSGVFQSDFNLLLFNAWNIRLSLRQHDQGLVGGMDLASSLTDAEYWALTPERASLNSLAIASIFGL